MSFYFTTSTIPEMANLTAAQRRLVKDRCVFWLFRRFPYRLGSLAITVVFVLVAVYLIGSWKWGIWKAAASALVGVSAFDIIYDMIWLAHWRPEVARFIRLHASELETTV
jgi:hypothetical protein